MPQCSAEYDLGPGCGVNYCVLEPNHPGPHRDGYGKTWQTEPREDTLSESKE